MGIQAVAKGRVVGAPVEVLSDSGRITALLLSDDDSRESTEYEVICRTPSLAKLVLDEVSAGDKLVAVGELRVRRVLSTTIDESCAAVVTLEATTVAHRVESR